MSSRIKDWKASKALTTRHDRRKEVNEVQRKQRSALVNQLRPGLDAIDSDSDGEVVPKESRMEKLAKFKREKQMKKKLEMDSKKPAFKVGVYRLEDSKVPPLHVGGRASMVNSSKVGTVMPSTSKSSSTFDIKKKRKLATTLKSKTSQSSRKPKAAKNLGLARGLEEAITTKTLETEAMSSEEADGGVEILNKTFDASDFAQRSTDGGVEATKDDDEIICKVEKEATDKDVPKYASPDPSPILKTFETTPEVIVPQTPRRSARIAALQTPTVQDPSFLKNSQKMVPQNLTLSLKNVARPSRASSFQVQDVLAHTFSSNSPQVRDNGTPLKPTVHSPSTPTLENLSLSSAKKVKKVIPVFTDRKPDINFSKTDQLITFTATPKKQEVPEFQTPSVVTRSVKRRRETSRFSGLLDSLRHDLTFERGTTSEKRRRKRGQASFSLMASIGIDNDADDSVNEQLENLFATQNDAAKVNLTEIDSILSSASKPSCSQKGTSINLSPPKVSKFAENLAEMEREEPQVDANHFQSLLEKERVRLQNLCDEWDNKASGPTIPNETKDHIRSVIGKAWLLMNKKGRFQQFSGLIEDCRSKAGDKVTTCADLQGYWDMMYIQIEEVIEAFEGLKSLEATNWVMPEVKEPEQENKKPLSRKRPIITGIKKPAKASASLKAMMAAKRRELKGEEAVPPSSPLAPLAEGEKVFDGGVFFSVRSPLRKIPAKSRLNN